MALCLTSDLCFQACGRGAATARHPAGPSLWAGQDEGIQAGHRPHVTHRVRGSPGLTADATRRSQRVGQKLLQRVGGAAVGTNLEQLAIVFYFFFIHFFEFYLPKQEILVSMLISSTCPLEVYLYNTL